MKREIKICARMNISLCWFYCHIVFRFLLLLNVVWEMNAKDSSSGHPPVLFSVSHIVIIAAYYHHYYSISHINPYCMY